MSNNDPWDNSGLIGSATASVLWFTLRRAVRGSKAKSSCQWWIMTWRQRSIQVRHFAGGNRAISGRGSSDLTLSCSKPTEGGIHAETTARCHPTGVGSRNFFKSKTDLAAVLKTFPVDGPMTAAVESCNGLRLLRQDPWECWRRSFSLPPSKSCKSGKSFRCFAPGTANRSRFPTESHRHLLSRRRLKSPRRRKPSCGLARWAFALPVLLAAARRIDSGQFDLESLRQMSHAEARQKLMTLARRGCEDCGLRPVIRLRI
jgi:hypothetical protein